MSSKKSEGQDDIIHDLKSEKKFLEKTVTAYEALTEYSGKELKEAHDIINAQESVLEMSRLEIMSYKEQEDETLPKTKLEKDIINILDEDPHNEEYIVEKLTHSKAYHGEDFFVTFFRVLINIEFSEQEARHVWAEVINNKKAIVEKLGRSVTFRVAMLDYFTSYNKHVKNPKIIEIKLYEKTLESAFIDSLTGTYNRKFFDETIEREVNRAKRHKKSLSLFLIDLDDFKQVNDKYGHVKGDEVLRKTGKMLRASFRKEDIVCRYGGEEFIVVMPETEKKGATEVAERFRINFKENIVINNKPVTFSGGIANFPGDADDEGDLLIKADRWMYKAKAKGKDQIYNNLSE